MANDYLSGSQFGNVAGALLARKRRGDRREMQRALLATTLFETIGAFQRRQTNKLNTALTELKEDFDLGTTSRAAVYNSEINKNNRELVRLFEQDKNKAINKLAKDLYNNDDIITSRNFNFNMRGKIADPEAKALDEQFYQSKLREAENMLKTMQENPLYNQETFVKYNQVYHDEYKSAMKALRNDPTKQGLLKAAAAKIFPNFFSTERADFENVLENADDKIAAKRKAQEDRQFFSPDKKVFNKKEAIDFVNTNLSGREDIDEKTILKIMDRIDNKKDIVGITENEIYGIALSEKILNQENLNIVEKEINNATQLFNAGYERQFGPIPTNMASEEGQDYQDRLQDYLDINVYKVQPETSKINQILRNLEASEEGSQQYKFYQKQLQNLNKDDLTEYAIKSTLNFVNDAEQQVQIQLLIDEQIAQVKNNPNYEPLYTDFNSYFAWKMTGTLEALEYYRELEEDFLK